MPIWRLLIQKGLVGRLFYRNIITMAEACPLLVFFFSFVGNIYVTYLKMCCSAYTFCILQSIEEKKEFKNSSN